MTCTAEQSKINGSKLQRKENRIWTKGDKIGILEYTGEDIIEVRSGRKRYFKLFKCECGEIKKLRSDVFDHKQINKCTCNLGTNIRDKLLSKLGKDYGFHLIWKSASYGAKTRCIDFNITIQDVKKQYKKQSGLCYYTGEKFVLPNRSDDLKSELTPSIDRIDSELGYIPSNIVLCIKDINYMKGTLSIEKFVEYCRKVSLFAV